MVDPNGADETVDEALAALRSGFRDEARELLGEMEAALMELEARPDDGELVAQAFRALHTIKGNGAMFGLTELESFAHDLEHVFDLLRKGRMAVSREIVGLALGAKDRLTALLEPGGDTAEEGALRAADRARMARLVGAEGGAAGEGPPPALVEAFKDEARDTLAEFEGALMQLEERPADGALLARAFRLVHSLKGNAGMFGFPELEAFAHELEGLFEQLRARRAAVTGETITLALGARDRILRLLSGAPDDEAERALREAAVAAFRALAAAAAAAQPLPDEAAAGTVRIVLRPDGQLFAQGTDPLPVFEELRSMGPCQVGALCDEVPALEQLDPEHCYLGWEILLSSERPLREVRDAFIFVGGDAAVAIAPGAAAEGAPPPAAPAAAPPPVPREPSPTEAGAAEPAPPRALSAQRGATEAASTLRVAAAKLDKLVDLVGELVTVQARLSRLAAMRADQELLSAAEEVERLTGELRDHSLNVRMVPIGPAFARFRRLVRDLSHEVGREVELATEGDDTELDKSVIDRLGDPIVHLLRNAIDHGVEPPEARLAAGKAPRALVRISAAYAGANVLIRVEDDGRGVDAAAVRRQAVRRGLIAEADQRPDAELFALMFLPGFSTSERVTTVSGRGVGLDVVKQAVEGLRGAVRVESRQGAGTAFEIRIPLTLAIIEGLDVVLGDEHLILPLTVVKECVELVARRGAGGRETSLAEIRGELVPYVRLREWFRVPGAPPGREQIVVTESDGRRVGLVVDHVVGGQQTVIKPLGRLFRDVRGLAGATILGDGTVALILDVAQLVQHVEREEAARAADH